ncbi:hypothetical protein GCM10027272_23900 [Hymenobacter frigidus]
MMHLRDELARTTTHLRQAVRANSMLVEAKLTRSVAAASALAVGAVGVVTGLLVVAGGQLVKSVALSDFWRTCWTMAAVFTAALLAGMSTEWLCRLHPPQGVAGWRCGVGVWAWVSGAAMVYCVCTGMPLLLTVLVLFLYGLPLHVLVLGSAWAGAGLARYGRKRAARRVL